MGSWARMGGWGCRVVSWHYYHSNSIWFTYKATRDSAIYRHKLPSALSDSNYKGEAQIGGKNVLLSLWAIQALVAEPYHSYLLLSPWRIVYIPLIYCCPPNPSGFSTRTSLYTLPHFIVALMFWSDATHLTSFGDEKLWPLYLYFGNNSKYEWCRPSNYLCEHVAYFEYMRLTLSVLIIFIILSDKNLVFT